MLAARPVGGGRLGKRGWPQHELESASTPPEGAWSAVITSRPPCLYAGESRIFGTICASSASAAASPPGPPPGHGPGLASWQRSGRITDKVGVRFASVRSASRPLRPTSSAAHAGESVSAWKYMKGLRKVAYG